MQNVNLSFASYAVKTRVRPHGVCIAYRKTLCFDILFCIAYSKNYMIPTYLVYLMCIYLSRICCTYHIYFIYTLHTLCIYCIVHAPWKRKHNKALFKTQNDIVLFQRYCLFQEMRLKYETVIKIS